ncbi:MAG: tRNA glutamyl-Q(34) synthetase GluQRS [Gammaproteobacteria bacterium]|nr:tRNA glutamyl-Q(34) synthetase GluQRS [Gammaproteobacteria bacterium]
MNTYRGRFAPSPSGPLHFGSLIAALGSWLDARHHKGKWFVRIEDIDPPREIAGAADNILATLENFGLIWDGQVTYQSENQHHYQQVLLQLFDEQEVYRCTCTRKQIQSSNGIYTNFCRDKQHSSKTDHSLRLKIHQPVTSFEDCYHGHYNTALHSASEDFIVKRKDGFYAYMLAVVVDDIEQQITHVIRGADLLETTSQQLYLFKLLKYSLPIFGHLPVATNNQGLKLSKQNYAPSIADAPVNETLWLALNFLKQSPPIELRKENTSLLLDWATQHWQPNKFKGKQQFLHQYV